MEIGGKTKQTMFGSLRGSRDDQAHPSYHSCHSSLGRSTHLTTFITIVTK